MGNALGAWLQRRKRLHASAFDPRNLPHRALAKQLLEAHLPLLQVRLRQEHIGLLLDAVLTIERSPTPLTELAPPAQLALLMARVGRAATDAEFRREGLQRQFAAFAQHYGRAEPQTQPQLVEAYLRDTVKDPTRLAEDLAAMQRNMGIEALRERNLSQVLKQSIIVEIALWFMARATSEVRKDPEALAQLQAAQLDGFCLRQLDQGIRWPVRWAAGEALEALWLAWPPSSPRDATLDQLWQVAIRDDEQPWVQAGAVRAMVRAKPLNAHQIIRDNLAAQTGPLDLYRRKLVLRLAAEVLAPNLFAPLLIATQGQDPSEHVRMSAVELAGALITSDLAQTEAEVPLLQRTHELMAFLARATEATAEPSHRVRATAMLALATLAQGLAPRLTAQSYAATQAAPLGRLFHQAIEILLAATGDRVPFSANVACEELTKLGDAVRRDAPTLVPDILPRWIRTLHERLRLHGIAPHSAESISACAEHLALLVDDQSYAALHELAPQIAAMPPHSHRALPATSCAAVARCDDATLARVLAHLTRRDWGISAARHRGGLRVWRGDVFRRRYWRIAHELRHPLPNKRQAFWHTIGRVYPGTLRAHPGLLDEATATTVPGERVTVDAEGSWGRHLPLVDDIIDLPLWRRRSVTVASSYGLTTLTPPPRLWQRLRNALVIGWRYQDLAGMRLASLATYRDRFRRKYVEELTQHYEISVTFTPHQRAGEAPVPDDVNELYQESTNEPAAAHALALPALGAAWEWLLANEAYLRSPSLNSQTALVAFAAGMSSLFFSRAWQKRREIDRARASMPMTIGGWGTRGKSGTERLKAGMFDGLGFDIFVKTTGCEAMFIHSAPMQTPVEIYIYRPYDKATIWEQKNMLELASRFRSQVMMWECMALNPKYVQLLQHEWMNDDLVTLTNSYPDHEDIQGPAGYNVAEVITEFIPTKKTLVTSEATYVPMFAQVAKRRGTPMYTVGDRDAELIGDDVLNLFPYREHPRNIALVTRMATELGIDPDLARLTMAQYVVPDLGVLKAYPPAVIRGRRLTFICGNSANERTGFINNWRRMKLDRMNLEAEPDKLVVTVVNNRADRISRSEVFARILVRDVAFDRHVLIGTNLGGLMGFLNIALDTYLAEQSFIEADELTPGEIPATVATRVARELGNLRIPATHGRQLTRRLNLYVSVINQRVRPDASEALTAWFHERITADAGGGLDVHVLKAAIVADASFRATTSAALEAIDPAQGADAFGVESLEPATLDEALDFLAYEMARLQIRHRLEHRLTTLFTSPSEAGRQAFIKAFRDAYRTMFLAQVVVIHDAGASGDQINDQCARCVPPASDVALMGTQNIKGTGLDFVYRWLAMDKVMTGLRDIDHVRADRRASAMAELEGFEDYGMVDAGYLRKVLARPAPDHLTDDDRATRARILAKADGIWQRRRAALVEEKKTGKLDRFAALVEAGIDWLDSVRRARQSQQILDDLINQRVSHARASVEMRKLVDRVKGKWLIKSLRKRASK